MWQCNPTTRTWSSRRRVEEEADEARADGAAGDAAGRTMRGEHGLHAVGLIFKVGTQLVAHDGLQRGELDQNYGLSSEMQF